MREGVVVWGSFGGLRSFYYLGSYLETAVKQSIAVITSLAVGGYERTVSELCVWFDAAEQLIGYSTGSWGFIRQLGVLFATARVAVLFAKA